MPDYRLFPNPLFLGLWWYIQSLANMDLSNPLFLGLWWHIQSLANMDLSSPLFLGLWWHIQSLANMDLSNPIHNSYRGRPLSQDKIFTQYIYICQ